MIGIMVGKGERLGDSDVARLQLPEAPEAVRIIAIGDSGGRFHLS